MSCRPVALLAPMLLLACAGKGDDTNVDDPTPPGVAVLGGYTHTLDGVVVETLLAADDRLGIPSDLAVNPRTPDQLWVLNYDANAVVLATGLEGGAIDSTFYRSFGSDHFLANPMGIAFSDQGEFATVQDTDELTQGASGTPRDFMGPTLWDDNLDRFDAGHGSHLDMLHNSPLAGGVAWEADRIFWVFDGYHEAISRYNFNTDHGYGGADHSDGEVARYVQGQVARYEGTPSGLEMDRATGLLYIADSANSRVMALDTASGERAGAIGPNYDGGQQYRVADAELLAVFEDGDGEVGLITPSGLAIHDEVVYVADNEAGRILALSMEGELLDWLDLGREPGALGGLEVDASGNLLFTDMVAVEVVRISPLP
ncbi:MAG: hypothetical protein H6739_22335 [Alphaproteobacteria bacterium]|nr:hypothetical protein [Alphaproteobacteria bacterium]